MKILNGLTICFFNKEYTKLLIMWSNDSISFILEIKIYIV